MGNPFQQQARQRKVIYLGLIVALFTVSLLHRRFVVERQAENLQLREAARGEVELTSSFVRLSLTGSRGLATTVLWSMAIDRMMRHEWNELELLVNSISALQPYFITPWVFQSWNLAFNVAVECDRPHDKYYYVSRGLQLLAEGERRNQGTKDKVTPGSGQPIFPGNPEMRFYMGFYYQLKIGNSDERNTMRSLFDLSCIDPLKRRPELFRFGEGVDAEINKEKFEQFCSEHPRLVRRLREHLGYDSRHQIIKFLADNKDVPNRFQKPAVPNQKESLLEEPRKQFPVLPPVEPRPESEDGGPAWPRPTETPMSPETTDVFLVCRTWYQYAQEPLPPPLREAGVTVKEIEHRELIERKRKEENINYRPSKTMAIEIFRGYPARGQLYIAETLEGEGWFDRDGWTIPGWSDQGGRGEDSLKVGQDTKYHARPAWEKAYGMYMTYGQRTGMYLSPAELADLEARAVEARVKLKVPQFGFPPPITEKMHRDIGESYDALQRLAKTFQNRSMTNFDAHLHTSEAEKDPETILARKLLFHAVQLKKKGDQQALPLFTQAWPLWIKVWLRYPQFNQVTFVQDDVYEAMLHYMRLEQGTDPELFRSTLIKAVPMAIVPNPSWREWYVGLKSAAFVAKDPGYHAKVAPAVRIAEGPLELVAIYDGPNAKAVRDYWFGVTYAASRLGQAGFAPPVPMPDQANYALVGSIWDRRPTPPTLWRYLINPDVVTTVRTRLGLIAPKQEAPVTPPGENPLAPSKQ
jgi:hypothetical protein